MKCLILAAGYATRLYPLTENFPKPLLEVNDKTIIDWLIEDLNSLNIIDEYYIVTNHKYVEHFNKWNHFSNLKVIDDGTIENSSRLGAVKDIELVIKKENINDDLLIVAGDNLLDFSLKNYINYFININTSCLIYYCENNIDKLRKTGVAQIDDNDVVVSMVEKPQEPKNNNVIPPFYIIKKDDLRFINEAIKDGINVDAPGSLISYLVSKTKVHAYKMDGNRYDIGSIDSYEEAKNNYKGIKNIN